MRAVEVKICGVCSPADAAGAAAAGAAYVGVILAPGRSRSRSVADAQAIWAGTSVRRAGVFLDPRLSDVLRAREQLRLDVVQLHGSESPELTARVAGAGVQVWKAVTVRSAADVREAAARYSGAAHGLLLDGWSAAGAGGSGVTFDWHAVARIRDVVAPGLTFIVAGGLTPDNVRDVVALLRPDVVDVSSGVEASPGRKSPDRMHAFIAAARTAGRND